MLIRIIFWPFWALWLFVGFLLSMVGRLLAAIIGLAFLLVGAALTATIIGALPGIALIITGVALMARATFI